MKRDIPSKAKIMATTTKKKPWYKTENVIFIFPALLLLFMQLDAFAHWTFYGRNVQAASGAWWIVAIVCYALAIGSLIFADKSKGGVKPGHIVAAGVFWVLALCALAGFDFSIA